ncbi:MAG: hypothetical protein IT383_08165 [Deltaproteobacteria bacterium]|nr:hypothetical protein [Deltaproteobacteria bacterium]
MSAIDCPAAPAAIDDAVEAALGALLRDRDVGELQCLEGGFLQVLRRGRRERLDAVLEGPLFGLVRDHGAERQLIALRLRGGHQLWAGPCVDGRCALRVLKAPQLDVELDALADEGMLPPGLSTELAAAAAQGGVLVLGASRAGRQRLACAVARTAQRALAFAAVGERTAPLFPCPAGADVAAQAHAADALGFDALFALELTPAACAQLMQAGAALPLVASVRAPSTEAMSHALAGAPLDALAALVCVVGVGPDGRPRLMEMHGAADPGGPADASGAPAAAPRLALGRAPSAPPSGASAPGDELPPLAVPPSTWASDEPDDDPGWELAGLPADAAAPAPGSFDAALARQSARPPFAPRAPRPHPQAAALAGNPFGGLTFEPPPAPPGGEHSDGSAAEGDPDEEPR